MVKSCRRLPRDSLALNPLPLFSGLGTTEQLQVFAPTQPGVRKVIISTNLAEVSYRSFSASFLTRCKDECYNRRNRVHRGFRIREG
jgi:hypothetical protein